MFRVRGVGAGGDFLTRTQEVLAVKEHPETRQSVRGAAVGEDSPAVGEPFSVRVSDRESHVDRRGKPPN